MASTLGLQDVLGMLKDIEPDVISLSESVSNLAREEGGDRLKNEVRVAHAIHMFVIRQRGYERRLVLRDIRKAPAQMQDDEHVNRVGDPYLVLESVSPLLPSEGGDRLKNEVRVAHAIHMFVIRQRGYERRLVLRDIRKAPAQMQESGASEEEVEAAKALLEKIMDTLAQ